MSKKLKYDQEFKFFAEDFWNMIEGQKYKCALTGRELTPNNTSVELRKPNIKEGRANLDNHYLIDSHLSTLARHLSEDEIIALANEIVKYRGGSKKK